MHRPEISAVHAAMLAKGYVVFDNPKGYDINIVGIRATQRVPDVFDDLLTVSWVDRVTGEWVSHMWNATTDCGLLAAEQSTIEGGPAFLAPGQYRSSHMIRKHQGKYDAVCQKWGMNLPVFRLGNVEDYGKTVDWKPSFTWFGNGTGINIHRAREQGVTPRVANWSAGCQVFEHAADFEAFMGICRAAKNIWGNSFTYTLIDEADLEPGGLGGMTADEDDVDGGTGPETD